MGLQHRTMSGSFWTNTIMSALIFLHTGLGYLIFYAGSEIHILPMPSSCYYTHAVTRGLFISCIETRKHGGQCLVKVTSCDIASQHIQGLLDAYFKIKRQW